MNIRKKILIPVFLVELILVIVFLIHQNIRQHTQLEDTLIRTGESFARLIDSEIKADVAIMSTALDSISDNKEVQQLLVKMDIKALAKKMESRFLRLKSTNLITHFYFHSLDRVNLFRMHEPTHSGDKINRKTLIQAEAINNPTYGVEQGPTGASVLRVVYPVHLNSKRVGYLELGKEFQDIASKIQRIMGVQAIVMVKKEKVKREDWEKRNNKSAFKVSWDFRSDYVVMASSMEEVPSALNTLKFSDSPNAYLPGLNFLQNGQELDAMVVPFSDLSGEKNTQIVLLYDSSAIRGVFSKTAAITSFICFSMIGLLFLFYFFFLGKVEAYIHRQEVLLVSNSKLVSLGEMAGGMAHEINNPLASLKTVSSQLSEVMQEKPLDLKLIHEMIETIQGTTGRIANIVSGLRSFSRDPSDDPKGYVSAHELIKATLDLCTERFKLADIRIINEVKTNHIFWGREAQVSQVLFSLLNNSFEALPTLKEKWVKITAKEASNYIEIRVIDSGLGIPKNIRDKIFQPFYTTKEIGGGIGMGLSTAYGLVSANGGKIYYDESCSNTCFVIQLPRNKQHSQKNANAA